jgi:hypothetical protein
LPSHASQMKRIIILGVQSSETREKHQDATSWKVLTSDHCLSCSECSAIPSDSYKSWNTCQTAESSVGWRDLPIHLASHVAKADILPPCITIESTSKSATSSQEQRHIPTAESSAGMYAGDNNSTRVSYRSIFVFKQTKPNTVHTLELVAPSCVSSGALLGPQTTAFKPVWWRARRRHKVSMGPSVSDWIVLFYWIEMGHVPSSVWFRVGWCK